MPRIFLVNRYFFPDESATSQLASDLAFYLAGERFEIRVITSGQLYADATARLPSAEVIRGVHIERLNGSRFGRQSIAGRMVDYATFYVSAAVRLFRGLRRGDTVVSMTDPPLLASMCSVVARLRGARLINWVQDVFPEVAERLGTIRNKSLARILQRLRDDGLRHAAANVVIGERMSRMVGDITGQEPILLPNWALEEGTEDAIPLREEWELHDKFIVGYSGNLGRAHHLSGLIDVAAALRHTRVVFLFVGAGAQLSALKARVSELQLSNVIFKPYQPRKRLRQSLCLPDIHVVSLDPALEGLIVPSKFVGVIAVGKPVLCLGSAQGEIGTLVGDSRCGLVFDPSCVREIADALAALSENPAALERMAGAALHLWRSHFQRSSALNRWSALLRDTQAQQKCA